MIARNSCNALVAIFSTVFQNLCQNQRVTFLDISVASDGHSINIDFTSSDGSSSVVQNAESAMGCGMDLLQGSMARSPMGT